MKYFKNRKTLCYQKNNKMNKLIIISILILLLFTRDSFSESEMCFYEAAKEFGLSPEILMAISKVESDHNPRAVNYNKNGSVDFGHMQINSVWKKELKEKYNYLGSPCYNTRVGAWILDKCIKQYGYNYKAVACYHTGPITNPKKIRNGMIYVKKIQKVIGKKAKKNKPVKRVIADSAYKKAENENVF